MYIKSLSVSELNGYLKKVMDNDFILNNIRVKGEVSNLKYHSSGHIYFSLKDENSKINCVMFKTYALMLNTNLKEGMKVEAAGKISVYIKDGSYQLYCSEVNDIGLGELYVKFNQLKERLGKEGLFDEEVKKALPPYRFKIGVITSPTGAAIKDIINVSKRRNPYVEIVIYPALVQGNGSVESLIKGIDFFNKKKDVDVIIIARGGGSIEELWSFNEEKLAYAIYNCSIPVISGVGHESDFTICDMVADRRAATPSQAAEIAVELYDELINFINISKEDLTRYILDRVNSESNALEIYKRTLENYNPINFIVHKYEEIDGYALRLHHIIESHIQGKVQELSGYKNLLDAYNPLNVLNKGYTVVYQDNTVVKSAKDFVNSKNTLLKFYDGSVEGKFNVDKKEISNA